MCDAIVVGICKRTLQGGAIAKVGFDNFEIGIGQVRTDIRALDRWIVKVVEVIDDGDIPRAFAEQLIEEMRADESRAAGDEDVLHAGCSLPLWGRVGVRACDARPSPQPLSQRERGKRRLVAALQTTSSHKSTNANPNVMPAPIRLSAAGTCRPAE